MIVLWQPPEHGFRQSRLLEIARPKVIWPLHPVPAPCDLVVAGGARARASIAMSVPERCEGSGLIVGTSVLFCDCENDAALQSRDRQST